MFLGKAIVTAQRSLSSNYCLRVTAEGTNQNTQRTFFNTEIILISINQHKRYIKYLPVTDARNNKSALQPHGNSEYIA